MHTLDILTQNQINITQQTKHNHFESTNKVGSNEMGISQSTNPKHKEDKY